MAKDHHAAVGGVFSANPFSLLRIVGETRPTMAKLHLDILFCLK
jgi:hypothetical protein